MLYVECGPLRVSLAFVERSFCTELLIRGDTSIRQSQPVWQQMPHWEWCSQLYSDTRAVRGFRYIHGHPSKSLKTHGVSFCAKSQNRGRVLKPSEENGFVPPIYLLFFDRKGASSRYQIGTRVKKPQGRGREGEGGQIYSCQGGIIITTLWIFYCWLARSGPDDPLPISWTNYPGNWMKLIYLPSINQIIPHNRDLNPWILQRIQLNK